MCTLPYAPGALASTPGVTETDPDIARENSKEMSDEIEARMIKIADFFGLPIIDYKRLPGYYYGNIESYALDGIHYGEIVAYRLGQIYARELLKTKNISSNYFDNSKF